MHEKELITSSLDRNCEGVLVQTSSVGALEALLFLSEKTRCIYANSWDEFRAERLENLLMKLVLRFLHPILCLNCAILVRAHIANVTAKKKEDATRIVVFPCLLHIILDCIINRKDPILVGVDVFDGIAKVGTPLCIPSGKFVDIGWIESIEIDKKPVSVAKKGRKAAIKVHNFYRGSRISLSG